MATKRLVLVFPKETTGKPLASQLIRNFDVEINILKAFIDDDVKGTLLIEVWGKEGNIEEGIEFLIDSGLTVREVISVIDVDRDKCIECGACTAACGVEALTMDDTASLVYNDTKCLECRLCIRACPVKAISTLI